MVRPFAPLTLVAVLVMAAGCSRPMTTASTSAAAPTASVTPTATATPSALTAPKSGPRIWHDKSGEEVAKLVAPKATSLWVYRWEGGAAEGWVEFDQDAKGGPTKRQVFHDTLNDTVERYRELNGGQPPSPEGFSGMIVISRRPLKGGASGPTDGTDWYDCEVAVRKTYTEPKKEDGGADQTSMTAYYSGRISTTREKPPAKSAGTATTQPSGIEGSVERQRFVSASDARTLQFGNLGSGSDVTAPWLELRLAGPAKPPG